MNRTRLFTALLLAGSGLAALACLVWIVTLAPGTPEPEAWRNARGDDALRFTWYYFAHAPDLPRLALFRLAYMGLLFAPGGDFGRFGVVSWGLVGGCILALALLMRRTGVAWHGQLWPWVGLVLFTGWAFSPAFGADWLAGSRFGVFVPPVLLLFGILLLLRPECAGRRVVLAALLSVAALSFDRTGILNWIVLLPLVVVYAPAGRRVTRAAFWLILGNLFSVLSFLSPWADEGIRRAGLVHHTLDDPLGVLWFVARAAGDGVPRFVPGSEVERGVVGALLFGGLVVLLVRTYANRGDGGKRRRALPWAVLATFGAGCAIVLCDAHFPHVGRASVLRELGWSGVFLFVGVVGMLLARADVRPGRALTVVAVVVALLVAQDWHHGWETMKVRRAEMHQAGALLVFAPVLPERLPPEVAPAIFDQELSLLLRDMGRLREAAALPTAAFGEFEVEEAPDTPGELSEVTATEARGVVRATTFRFAADLVLVTEQRPGELQRILRIAAPDFSGGGKVFPWTAEIGAASGPVREVRAYGFHLQGRRLYPLAGRFVGEEKL